MRKGFVFLAASVAFAGSNLVAEYVAEQFTHPKTGKNTIFWGNKDNGKDGYVLEYDEIAEKFYFDKIEKNKPSIKKEDVNKPNKLEKNINNVKKANLNVNKPNKLEKNINNEESEPKSASVNAK